MCAVVWRGYYMWFCFFVFFCKEGKNEYPKRIPIPGCGIFFIFCKLKYFSAVEACTLKFSFSCLRSCYFARLTLLWCRRGIWLGTCQSSDSIYDQQIRLCLLVWHNNNIHPCQAWSEFKYQTYCFFKHAVFIQKVRWAMSLCAYVMMKRALVEDVDAAPLGWVPKLLDDTDYSLYCIRLFFIVSRPHWAVVLVGKNAEDMRLESHLRRWHSSEFWAWLPGLFVLHLDRILFINMHMQR